MLRFMLGILFMLTALNSKTVDDYLSELRKLTDSQSAFLVAGYEYGKKYDLGYTLASIIWKESSFGNSLVNKKDGKYGSFGLAQILLQTSMSRNGVNPKNRKAVEKLVNRLITDHVFNLQEATAELLYWKKYYKETRKSKWWYTHMVASYNAGWRGYKSNQGKAYYDDIKKRNAALKIFLKQKKYWNKFLKKYLVTM